MSVLNKYNNNVNRFDFEQEKNVEYKKLSDLYEANITQLKINSLFINTKGKFGDSPVATADGFNINLPTHLLDTVKEMIEDDDVIALANQGNLGIQIYQYDSKKWGKNYSSNFIDFNELPF